MKLSISRSVAIQRKWFLASTPQAAVSDNLEQCNMQNFSNLNSAKIKPYSLIPKQTYSGDRFIPCRSRYDFEAAHYLLKKGPDDMTEPRIVDILGQIDSFEAKHRRETLHTLMVKQDLIPGLKQNKILHFNNSGAQNPLHLESKKEGTWKCTSRKRALIGNVEKILCMPDFTTSDNIINEIDWSCNNMIAVSTLTGVTIYDDNGTVLMTWTGYIANAVKWSNDGSKLMVGLDVDAVIMDNDMKFKVYDVKKKKLLWENACKCVLMSVEGFCMIYCVCWSLHDRYIVTGCRGSICVYKANTGKLVYSRIEHISYIKELSFSTNFNYLASIGADGTLRVFTWPEMICCRDIPSYECVRTVAWHPQESSLLCIGGTRNGSLLLWDFKTHTRTGGIITTFDASVNNLLWNKLSGELLVNFRYEKDNTQYTTVPVFANFNRIVDVLPLEKNVEPWFMKFNATHEQLITYCNYVLSIWNFFGNEKPYRERCVTLYNSARRRQGVIVHDPIR